MKVKGKYWHLLTRVGPRQNNDSRESEMDSREKIGIAKIIHKIA